MEPEPVAALIDANDAGVLKALTTDCLNGFGFQVNGERKCLYIGRVKSDRAPFHVSQLCVEGVEAADVRLTDWLAVDYVAVHVRQYNRIPAIINAILDAGHGFVTQNASGYDAEFKPGEHFSRASYEQHLISTLRKVSSRATGQCAEPWQQLNLMFSLRRFTKHWNYATREGQEFCTELRTALHKKSERSTKTPRMEWPDYAATATKYGILHAGGWARYGDATAKRVKNNDAADAADDDECRVCLDRAATTTALPCGCRVVCDECSRRLSDTPDNKKCVRCRADITHVAYKDNNEIQPL